jgi:hypothetical protein
MVLVDRRSVLLCLVYEWRALVFSIFCFADIDQFFSNVNNLSILQYDWVGLPRLNYPGNVPVRLDLPSDVTDN